MIHFLRVLRPVNLLIIVLTMYLIRYFIMQPFLLASGYTFQLTAFDFFLLVFSTVLIAGAGNIINDYFDIKADRINKPHKVIIGKYIKRRVAMLTHIIFNAIAVSIGFYLSWKVEVIWLGFIHIFSTSLLWFYSLLLKRKFLTGNIIVAILSGMIPLLPGWFEIPLLKSAFPAEEKWSILYWCLYIYAGFAFMVTLIREIQKDMADVPGDKAVGCKTMPVILGAFNTKAVLALLMAFTIGMILFVQQRYLDDPYSFYYVLFLIIFPIFVSMGFTILAKKRKQHLAASTLMKTAMATAVLYAILFSNLYPVCRIC